MTFIHQNRLGRRLPFEDVGGKVFGQADKLVWCEDIGYVNSLIKTDDLGNCLGLYPDQEKGASNTHHGGRGSYLKGLFLELQQVFGKYPDFSEIYLEGRGPFLFLGIKFKLIQV